LLESKSGISYTNSQLTSCLIWLPNNLGSSSLNLIWVFEDHEGLGVDVFSQMFSLFASEIFLEEIDLIVLSDAANGALSHTFSCYRKTEGGLSVHLLLILGSISLFSLIVFDWPSAFFMFHTFVTCWDYISVNL
jgi:hypothetical protein